MKASTISYTCTRLARLYKNWAEDKSITFYEAIEIIGTLRVFLLYLAPEETDKLEQETLKKALSTLTELKNDLKSKIAKGEI